MSTRVASDLSPATDQAPRSPSRAHEVTSSHPEPPVIARVVIEIRSDGTQTIARGAMEDLRAGERVAIEARGSSLLQVALQLAGSMRALPQLVRGAAIEPTQLAAGSSATQAQSPPRKRDRLMAGALKVINKIR